MAKIEKILAQEVLDSRGNPTVLAHVNVEGGNRGTATVPSGASTGRHEAHELRDGDEKRYEGKGVLKAVENVKNKIQPALIGKNTANQQKIDRVLLELDGSPNKSSLGANAMLAVSLACARAEAAAQGLPLFMYLKQLYPDRELKLPVPQLNLINGGKHASNGLSVQEFHVLPIGAVSFAESLRMGVEVMYKLKNRLIGQGMPGEVGDEGGFAPRFSKSEDVFNILVASIEEAGYVPGVDVFIGIDAAATEFYTAETATYALDGSALSSHDLAWRYAEWRKLFPLISIEDPFAEDDWPAWESFTAKHEKGFQVVGDDLYVTNVTRIKEGIEKKAANAVLVKPNQIGTLSETLQAILISQEAGHNVVISHRSGETEDTFISDLAVAVGAGQIKTGAPQRSDRTAKYNRLLEIELETGAALFKQGWYTA